MNTRLALLLLLILFDFSYTRVYPDSVKLSPSDKNGIVFEEASSANWQYFESGKDIPITQKGYFKLVLYFDSLNEIENPRLYLDKPAFPLELYAQGENEFNWSSLENPIRWQTVRSFAIPVDKDSLGRTKVEIILNSPGRESMISPIWIDHPENTAQYVFLQNLANHVGISIVAVLSFLLGLIILGYSLFLEKKKTLLFFAGLFAISEGLGYSIFLIDGPGTSEFIWLKLSRSAIILAACFLLSSHVRLIKNLNKIWKRIEKISYVIGLILFICIWVSSDIYQVNNFFKIAGVSLVYPTFILLFILSFKSLFIRKEITHRFMFWGILSVIITSSIDMYHILQIHNPYVWVSAYGQFFHILTIIATIATMEYKVRSQLVKVKDELISSYSELKNVNIELEKSSEKRESFIRTVSHELRTPLNAVIGITNEFTHEDTKVNAALKSSVQRLHLAISNIFAYESLDQKQTQISTSPQNPMLTLNAILNSYKEALKNRGLIVKTSLVPENKFPKYLLLNRNAWELIVHNSLSNAIKFSKPGVIFINLSYINDRLIFSLRDNGLGFPEKMLSQSLDDLDKRQKFQYTRADDQMGIGMMITRQQVNQLKGQMQLANHIGGGAVINISIPSKRCPSEIPNPKQNHHILLFEDNKVNQMILSKLFDKMGIKCTIAQDGMEGVEKYIQDKDNFTFVFMDVQMPRMNGLEATKELRKLNCNIPIFALTANADEKTCLEAGMDGYLSKPYRSHEIMEVLQSIQPKIS